MLVLLVLLAKMATLQQEQQEKQVAWSREGKWTNLDSKFPGHVHVHIMHCMCMHVPWCWYWPAFLESESTMVSSARAGALVLTTPQYPFKLDVFWRSLPNFMTDTVHVFDAG